MTESLSITGLIEKLSDSRGPWGPIAIDVTEDVETDEGARTFSVPAEDDLQVVFGGPCDTIILKTPKTVNVTLEFAVGVNSTYAAVSVRNVLVHQFAPGAVVSITIDNPNDTPVLLTLAATLMTTT